jgi:phosphotransferase system enzyme I (PtsI)
MSLRHHNLGTVLRGVGVSPGIILGNAYRLDSAEIQIEHIHLPESLLGAEVKRLHEAVTRADATIDRLQGELEAAGHSDGQAINHETGEHIAVLDAHKLMLHDPMLLGEAEKLIHSQGINAEWALSEALQHILSIFEVMEDPFFKERGRDVQDVGEMLLRALQGDDGFRQVVGDVPRGAIVVAEQLSPAEALTLARLPVAAFVLAEGTPTSHTSIIAHSMDIPAVVGVKSMAEHVGDGERIIVDGVEGEVIVHPSAEEEILYSRRSRRAKAFYRALRQNRDVPATTICGGRVVILRGNLDLIDEGHRVLASGAEGVGLFRTEFLFLERRDLPEEDEQYAAYKAVLEEMSPHPVTMRTLDVGGDKLMKAMRPGMRSSSGLRAIRYCLQDRDLFETQLRALLRASAHGPLQVLIPFVTTVSELRLVKRIITKLRAQLVEEGHQVPENIPLGAMIELPAAALIAPRLAKEVDFFSVGTNDLIQYTLAVGRDDDAVEHLHQPLHPGVLALLKLVIKAGQDRGIPVSMCGEMAADPRYTLVLLGLGFDELSMNSASIPLVKEVIRRSTAQDGTALLNSLRKLETVEEITDFVDSHMVEHFADIVSPRMRGAPRHHR